MACMDVVGSTTRVVGGVGEVEFREVVVRKGSGVFSD
jgi:hypothetical protein